jgi:endonuclease/exonuclease/phosphatase family metal-dependent hydrolase
MLKPALRLLLLATTAIINAGAWMSILAAYISPEKSWLIAISGLWFIYSYTVALLWFLLMLFRSKIMAAITLIPIIAGFPVFLKQWNITSNNHQSSLHQSLKVLTYNVRVFDLYNWTHNLETRKEIFDFLKNENAGIYCFQEYYTSTVPPFNNTDSLKKKLSIQQTHTLLPVKEYGTDEWGIATFSKYPIINKLTVFSDPESANGCIATDVVLPNDTIRIYNVHLQSVRLGKNDYLFMSEFANKDNQQRWLGIKRIVVRLKQAFEKRSRQADIIKAHIQACPYKVIVAGDLNDTPASYAYRQISSGLDDTFLTNGKGISTTYNGPLPGLRIDYIMHSGNLACSSYHRHNIKLSDHYPVTAIIQY